jgi:hypothetical protein
MSTDEFPTLVRKQKLVITSDELAPVAAASPSPPPPAPVSGALPSLPPAPVYSGGERTHPGYTICTVREVLDDGHFSSEDSLVFPVPGRDTDSVVIEPRDGSDIRRALCNEITILDSNGKRLLRAADIRAQVLITDARLTVACSKFDKGGGWVGGPVAMIALNAGSKLLAAHRRRGKMLVGQVRYPWVHAVYAQNKGGWAGSEKLRLIVKASGEFLRLDLTFPKDVDATAIGTEVVRRAARFRLAHEPTLEPKERATMTELAGVAPIVWRRGDTNMAGHQFPSHWPAGPRSARFGLTGAV